MRAATAAADVRYPMTGEFEVRAALCTGWNFHADSAIDRLNFDLGTECRVDHADVLIGEDQVTFAGELLVRLYAQVDVEVALGTISDRFTTITETNGGSVINPGRNLDRDVLFFAFGAFAVADRTSLFRHLATSVARLTHDLLLDSAEHRIHDARLLASTLAGLAGFHVIARFNRGAFAV